MIFFLHFAIFFTFFTFTNSVSSTSGNGISSTSTHHGNNGNSQFSSSSSSMKSGPKATETSKTFSLPGVNPENVKISCAGNTVSVQTVQMTGNSSSTSSQSFSLPAGVDKATLETEFVNGVLTLKWAKPVATRVVEKIKI